MEEKFFGGSRQKGPAAAQRRINTFSQCLHLQLSAGTNWEACVPFSLLQLLQHFIACKCDHMVISSLTFPCEYGRKWGFIMTPNCWISDRWIIVDLFTKRISAASTRRAGRGIWSMPHAAHLLIIFFIHGAQQCIPPHLSAYSAALSFWQWEELLCSNMKENKQTNFCANANEHHELFMDPQ